MDWYKIIWIQVKGRSPDTPWGAFLERQFIFGGNSKARHEHTAAIYSDGHLTYFLIFSILKEDFFAFFIKLITYFCTSPI